MWYIYIGSADGLVLSGNKPLREPMLTKTYLAIWTAHNEFNGSRHLNVKLKPLFKFDMIWKRISGHALLKWEIVWRGNPIKRSLKIVTPLNFASHSEK